ncbi:hypothetical protein [Candidatus Ichthyocystis sparus]|uniref:hypothetical protein n=1 Tax=Candidatus Ichthyocystis sparus TaxID=1561004 RepID=UPI000AF8F332|nr:hypothetical protein [Candidatus Ichthyocystis sparus]
MNPVTGVGGASPSDDSADQADSGVLQQVHNILPGGVLDVATAVTAASIVVATSSVVTTSTALTVSATTSTVATTSVGKGGSGGRSDKGKGPAPKRHAAGSVPTTTSVHPVPASANPELSVPTSSVTTAACTTTADLNFDVILNSLIETARTRRAAADAADARASSAAVAAVRAHNRADAIPDTDPNLTRARARASARGMDKYARDVAVRAAAAAASAAAADHVVAQARVFATGLVVVQDRVSDSTATALGVDFGTIIDSVVATARNCHAAADAADARANSAATSAALAAAALAASVIDTDSAAARRARASVINADRYARFTASVAASGAADAHAAAAAADHVVAQARAFAPGRVVAQDRVADSTDFDLASNTRDLDKYHARAADVRSAAPRAADARAAAAVADARAAAADHVVAQARAFAAYLSDSSVTTLGVDFGIIIDSVVATARNCHAAADAADARASYAAAAAARAAVIPDTDPDLARARDIDKYARDTSARAADARAAATAADHVVALAYAFAADHGVAQDRLADRSADSRVPITCRDFDIILDSVVTSALAFHDAARDANARANSAAAAVARSSAVAAVARSSARAAAPIPDTDNAARARRARPRARASARARFCARAADSEDRAADSLVPSPGPDSSLVPPGFVDSLGFVVSLEFSEVVSKLISAVSALAKDIIRYHIARTVSSILRNLSSSERSAWCLTNVKLYELKFLTRCFAEYSSKLLPTFINNLCGVRVWDSSSRSLVLLTGNRLADFWLSLDEAILKAIAGFFMPKWYELIGRSSASSGTVEGLSDLCGGDFVSACARAGTSSSSVSIFDSASEGMRARVASHDGGSLAGGDSVDLFGFEVPPEVEGMVKVLTSEVSALARRIYSSVVAVSVSHTLRELSFSEQCAWLIANMMSYRTSFMHRFFLEYCGGLCSEFICSLFRVVPGDASDSSLLPLTGDSLRGFWMSLSETVMNIVQDIFKAEWSLLTNQFSVLLGPGEESSSAVLCVGDFISARDKAGVSDLAASGMRVRGTARRRAVSHVTEVTSGSSVADVVSVAGGSCSVAAGDSSVVTIDVPPPPPPPPTTTTTTTSSSSLEPPSLFFTVEETGLSAGVVASEVLVVTEETVEDVIFIDDHSSLSEGELGGKLSSSLSEEEALVVEVSAPSLSETPVLIGEEEVEVSKVGLPMVGASVSDLGVLEGESSEGRVMPTTSASSVTSSSVIEVEGSSTIPRIVSSAGPVAPKKLFMKMYSAGMSSSSMSSGSIVSSGPLSSLPVATGIGSTLAATTGTASGGGDIGDRLAALLNRGLPPSPPPVSESAPTGGEASSSSRGSVRARRKRKRRN